MQSVVVETRIDHTFHQIPNDKTARWEAARSEAYWAYRRRWERDPVEHVVGPVPIHLDIDATSKCNLRCTMCPRTDMLGRGTLWPAKDFDLDLFKRLIDEGAEKGLCSIKFNYLGEPLLCRTIVDMVAYAKQRGLVDVMFNTNATLLDETLARRLIDAGLDKLFFSFDSPYREQYNRIRVNADYDRTLANIKNFMRIREEMGSLSPFTRVSMVRMRETESAWLDFKALFEPVVDAVAYLDYLDHNGQAPTDKGLVGAARILDRKFCCPQLFQRMFIHTDGVVSVCCIDSARELAVGTIEGKTLEELWNGPEYERLRMLHRTGRIDEIPVCARCPMAQVE